MIVDVDETGGEDKPFCVDDAVFVFGLEIPDSRDAVSHNADVSFAERLTCPVGDSGIENDC